MLTFEHMQCEWQTTCANDTTELKRKHTPIEAFCETKVTMNRWHWYHFEHPVNILDNDLQEWKKINKWQCRAWVGCCFEQLPQHATSVALVLFLSTGFGITTVPCPNGQTIIFKQWNNLSKQYHQRVNGWPSVISKKKRILWLKKRKRSRGTEHSSTEQSKSIGTPTQQTQGVRTQPEQRLPVSGSHTTDLARSNGSNDHEAQTQFADEASPINQVNDLTSQYQSGHKDMTTSISWEEQTFQTLLKKLTKKQCLVTKGESPNKPSMTRQWV